MNEVILKIISYYNIQALNELFKNDIQNLCRVYESVLPAERKTVSQTPASSRFLQTMAKATSKHSDFTQRIQEGEERGG